LFLLRRYLVKVSYQFLGYKDRPDSQANTVLSYLLGEKTLLPQEKIELLTASQWNDIQERMNQILSSVSSHLCYVHGNMEERHAIQFYEQILSKFPHNSDKTQSIKREAESPVSVDNDDVYYEKIRQLPAGQHTVLALPPFNKDDENNAYLLYIPVSERLLFC
jgi:secreted Zn-dependent insulinase-like peptidase